VFPDYIIRKGILVMCIGRARRPYSGKSNSLNKIGVLLFPPYAFPRAPYFFFNFTTGLDFVFRNTLLMFSRFVRILKSRAIIFQNFFNFKF